MLHCLPREHRAPEVTMDEACRILEVLGPMPAEALAAMADYGLSDAEMGRYFSLPSATLTALRAHWDIAGTP